MIVSPTQQIQFGKTSKPETGRVTIPFTNTFGSIPVVVVSSYWQGSQKGVTYIPTITEITLVDFTVTSNNADPNYFVNWIAIASS